jgi:hypothetical protein
LELAAEWAKVKAQQVEEAAFVLSMNAMVKALKVLKGLVVNERETNAQLFLELREVHKIKGVGPNGEVVKAMKTQMLDPFVGKDIKAKIVRQWVFQVEAYFESQAINTYVDRLRLAQSFLRDHTMEWWTTQKYAKPNLMGSLLWSAFKEILNEMFTPHNQILKDG